MSWRGAPTRAAGIIQFSSLVITSRLGHRVIIAPPELAAAAYERWRFLYAALLQGELNDSKSKCYSPKISTEAVRAAGMPIDVEITTEGTRVLGGPVGSVDHCRSFAESVVQEVIEDLDVVSRMSSLQAQHCLYGGFSSTSG